VSYAIPQNDWPKVRAFYDEHGPTILAGDRWEWAIPAYSWEECGGFRMTPIEAWLWADIRDANVVLYPQYPVGRFFVDFANPVAKVAIEYHLDRAKDQARDAELAGMGWTVYRIPGHVCRTEQDPETGAPSEAALFIRDIAARHRISRNHRPRASAGWHHIGRAPEVV
jgi:hypothetical protein